MSNFPVSYDDDTTLPPVNDNIEDIGGEAINTLRDAVFNIETEIGIGASGSTNSIAERIGVSLDNSGNIKPSAIAGLGLVTLPITNSQIADSAQIPEYKLDLDHSTQDLYNYIQDLSNDINIGLGWINTTGIKLAPHLSGVIYRHILAHVDVTNDPTKYLKNKFELLRNNTDSFEVLNDLNNEFLNHQFADGSPASDVGTITTLNGSTYPSNYAHTSSGIFLNTSRFSTIPQTAEDLQQFAEFIDSSSIFLYGTRIQNLYTNGISRSSRSSSLTIDGYGSPIIPTTPAIAYLLNTGNSSSPFDDINYGDDIIEFQPSTADQNSNSFDEKFALIKIGDIIRINYGTIEAQFVIKETKYIQNGGTKKYLVRIAGKNLAYAPNAVARVDKSLVNNTKFGELSLSAVNNSFSGMPSLLVGNPRSPSVLGVDFNPDQLDETHYILYLALYPTGNPAEDQIILPGIDVTGNRGLTPGAYTLETVVEATNNSFRQNGYNYRFMAFSYQGEFGIMLTDSINNVGFSVLNGVVKSNGEFDTTATASQFINNVVDIQNSDIDPLGFGITGSNIASPQFKASYDSAEAALKPTKVFLPLKRNNYYVNGTERDKLSLDVDQSLDAYGDGYWVATVRAQNVFPAPIGRVQTTYRIPLDLSTSGLAVGKTLVVQSAGSGTINNFGRFIIQDVTFVDACTPNPYTDITVYDAVHSTGLSPAPVIDLGSTVHVYFGFDSVSFNKESATDFNASPLFKRHFEVYVDQNGKTFTHERGRINISGSTLVINGTSPLYTYSELAKLDIVKISPKLRGYQPEGINKISLVMVDYDSLTGVYDGYLAAFDGSSLSNLGPITNGKRGRVTRFYDETNTDYIDIIFNISTAVSSFTLQIIDFQLFPTLSLDDELMMLGTCQVNDVTSVVSMLRDERQFGNTSEKDLTTSAHNLISLSDRLLNSNGVVRGFDLTSAITSGQDIFLTGGIALVNGSFIQMNNETVTIPLVQELYVSNINNINWIVCVNDKGEYQPIPLLDHDTNLGTPNDPDRLFLALNPLTGGQYNIDAVLFSDLINKRKDLVPLYLASTLVTNGSPGNPPTLTLTISDVRKFINDEDSNLPLKLTSGNAQGNFRNVESIFNWLKYNSVYNSNAYVSGANTDNATINIPLDLDFSNNVVIDGGKNGEITFNQSVNFGSNLNFKNVDLIFNGGITNSTNVENLIFENCNITIVNVVSEPPIDNIIFNFTSGSNIQFINCNINITYNSLISYGAVIKLTNIDKFTFLDGSLNVTFDILAGSTMPGNIFELHSCDGAIIHNSQFSGNFNKFVEIDNSNNVKLTELIVTSTYNPNAGVNPDSYDTVFYDPTDLVNSGQGYIHGTIANILDNIQIDDVEFNYSPTIVSGDRYSFINFELTTTTSLLSNLKITNCRFNHTNLNTTTDDVRPAISIINTVINGTVTTQVPTLLNAIIEGNSTNKNQSIIVTSKTNASGQMTYPGLMTVNCKIAGNSCGTIGYWITSGNKFVNIPSVVNSLLDRDTGLLISNNACHYISNLNHKGMYFQVAKVVSTNSTNFCSYPSGYVTIKGNECNWIHVGIAFEDNASLRIVDNNLTAFEPVYMNTYNDVLDDVLLKHLHYIYSHNNVSNYAIVVNANVHVTTPSQSPGESNDSNVIISGNSTNTGYWRYSNLTATTYRYGSGYVFCASSCVITNNVFKGVDNTGIVNGGAPSALIKVGGVNHTITNNKIHRQGQLISAYVSFGSNDVISNSPSWLGGTSTAIVTENFFDSTTVNGTSKTLVEVPFNAQWIVERNINQTVTTAFNVFTGHHTHGSNHRLFPGTVPAGIYILAQNAPTQTVRIIYIGGSGALDSYQWTIPLYSLIPKKTRVTSVSVSVTNTNLASVASPITLTLIDPSTANTDSDTGNVQATISDTLTVVPTGTNVYFNNESSLPEVMFNLTLQSTGSLTVYVSDIQVSYQW